MKIQNIALYKTNLINKKINNNYTTNKIQTDSFSFRGEVLSYDKLRNLKLKSYQIQNESQEYKLEAQNTKDEAYSALQEARNEFIQALKYCKSFKKDPTKTQIELENGNTLSFQFQYKNGNFTLEIEEFADDGEIIKTISALNFIPIKVINYSEDKVDYYEYRGNKVAITKNLNVGQDDFGSYDRCFNFSNGKLNDANVNGRISLDKPAEFEKTFVYFDDKLMVCSLDNQIAPDGTCSASERFVYIGDSFSNYYSNFNGDIRGRVSWLESLHYDRGRLIGSINNGAQIAKNADILSSDAIYLDDNNQFIHTTKLRARVSDFGLPIFADYEN